MVAIENNYKGLQLSKKKLKILLTIETPSKAAVLKCV